MGGRPNLTTRATWRVALRANAYAVPGFEETEPAAPLGGEVFGPSGSGALL
jgi:hypothetical protein